MNNITDTKGLDSYFILNSSTAGLVNFTIWANFSQSPFIDLKGVGANTPFDWKKVLGINYTLTFNISMDANLTVFMRDYNDGGTPSWKNITSPMFYNSSLGPHTIDEIGINENLGFFNPTDTCYIQFVFNRSDAQEFNATIYSFDMNVTYPIELSITNNNYVALEFDLKGLETTVNGFSAWIRTLNRTKAINSELNITLYKANSTITRTYTNFVCEEFRVIYKRQLIQFIAY